MENTVYQIDYEFIFDDGRKKLFPISLDIQTISLVPSKTRSKPEWTRLENDQCKCCPLTTDVYPHCSVAVNLADLVEAFKDIGSTEKCLVQCTTPDRTYLKKTSVQEGLFSIFGLIMATSDCPEMAPFKPMARFHLPFADVDETVFRFMASYLIRQYFEYKDGKTPDLDLTKLPQHFKVIEEVNEGILARIRNVSKQDADKNALIILHYLSQMVSMEVDQGLSSIKYLFTLETRPTKGKSV